MWYFRVEETWTAAVTAVAAAILLFLGYQILFVIYNVFFHPLSKFPGPYSSAISRLPWLWHLTRGKLPHWVSSLHDQYNADIVRVAPNELSYISPSAWRDIHGNRPGHLSCEKNPAVYSAPANGTASLVSADRENHARMRKVLAHAFSDRATRDYEPVVESYVDTLITRLYEQIAGPQVGKVDISDWTRYMAFDIAGDLSFGESFGCLENQELHPWAHMVQPFLEVDACIAAYSQFPLLQPFIRYLIDEKTLLAADEHFTAVGHKVAQRVNLGTDRSDFMTPILKHNEKGHGLTLNEMKSNASVFIVAGSDTSAQVLTATLFYLLQNPATLLKVTHEVRSSFKHDGQINSQSSGELPFLAACLDETHRIYPPLHTGQSVIVPPEGDLIGKDWLPGKTGLSIHMYAAFRSERNFKDPHIYAPERWLGDPRFALDNREVFQPFAFGNRNCIGKRIGVVETRLVLARLLWNFDFQRCAETAKDWLNQKAFTTWQRKALIVRLSPRGSSA